MCFETNSELLSTQISEWARSMDRYVTILTHGPASKPQ